MYPIIENMSASETTDLTKVPDCPHDHVKDLGIEELRELVKNQTDDGLKIVKFLVKAMEGDLPNYEPHHELEAAKILSNLGSDEAAEYVRSYGARRKRASTKGERTSAKNLAADYGQSDPYLVIEPVISDIARFIRKETSSGKTIVRRLIQIMETHEDPYKPHHNLAAAKELLNRGWSMPNAVECSWLCVHHVSAEYFNGRKSQNGHKSQNPARSVVEGDDHHTNQKNHTNHSSDESAPEADTAQAVVAVEDSQEEPAPYSDTGASPENSPTMSFTDIDSLPDRFWMRVLDLCERLEERGRIPPLPLGPDDPLPNIDRVKVVDFPEVDLTDDDVAARFWARVGEQIEIQEDRGELSRYSPERPGPSIWELVLDRMRSQSQQPTESQQPQDP